MSEKFQPKSVQELLTAVDELKLVIQAADFILEQESDLIRLADKIANPLRAGQDSLQLDELKVQECINDFAKLVADVRQEVPYLLQ